MHRDNLQREALEREREAIEHEALEQQTLERELVHRRAALMGYGGGRGGMISAQEAEYMQQLRLEALVQQRRQETFSQLALAQEMGGGYDLQAYAQAQYLRQAALLRQAQHEQMMLSVSGGGSRTAEQVMSRSSDGGRQDQVLSEEVQRLEERNRKEKYMKQQQLANLGFGQQGTSSRAAEMAAAWSAEVSQQPHAPLSLHNQYSTSAAKKSKKSPHPKKTTKLEQTAGGSDSKVTIVSCPARGMPLDHDTSSAYFKIPDDIKHGTELVCSYYGCRNAGAQVR
jgi:hypothetical protein